MILALLAVVTSSLLLKRRLPEIVHFIRCIVVFFECFLSKILTNDPKPHMTLVPFLLLMLGEKLLFEYCGQIKRHKFVACAIADRSCSSACML